MEPKRESRASDASVMLALTGIAGMTPWRSLSSGRYAMPHAMACAGLVMRTGIPRSRISPESGGVSPKIVPASSVRPAPTSPARPKISPARSERLTPLTPAARQTRRRSSSTTPPNSTVLFGKTADNSRPTINWISSPKFTSASSFVSIVQPSRSTVTRSAITANSSNRCET